MDDETLVHQFTEGRFNVRIYLVRAAGELFTGHVDIYDRDVQKCSILSTGPLEQASATAALAVRSRDWISGWSNRDHSGDTGLVEL